MIKISNETLSSESSPNFKFPRENREQETKTEAMKPFWDRTNCSKEEALKFEIGRTFQKERKSAEKKSQNTCFANDCLGMV